MGPVVLSDLIAYFIFDEIPPGRQTQLFFLILGIQITGVTLR